MSLIYTVSLNSRRIKSLNQASTFFTLYTCSYCGNLGLFVIRLYNSGYVIFTFPGASYSTFFVPSENNGLFRQIFTTTSAALVCLAFSSLSSVDNGKELGCRATKLAPPQTPPPPLSQLFRFLLRFQLSPLSVRTPVVSSTRKNKRQNKIHGHRYRSSSIFSEAAGFFKVNRPRTRHSLRTLSRSGSSRCKKKRTVEISPTLLVRLRHQPPIPLQGHNSQRGICNIPKA